MLHILWERHLTKLKKKICYLRLSWFQFFRPANETTLHTVLSKICKECPTINDSTKALTTGDETKIAKLEKGYDLFISYSHANSDIAGK